MSCNAVECRGGKGTNLTDFLLCPNKPVSTFDFHYIYIDTVRHSQVGNMISVCLCTLFSLSLSWNSKIPPLGRIKLKRALFCSALAYMYLCHYGDRVRFGMVKSEMKFPFASALTFPYICCNQVGFIWLSTDWIKLARERAMDKKKPDCSEPPYFSCFQITLYLTCKDNISFWKGHINGCNLTE